MEVTPNLGKVPSTQPSSREDNVKRFLDAMHIKFPNFKHEQHPQIINVNEVVDENRTVGAKIADAVAATVGSWPFIIIQSLILLTWILLNVFNIPGFNHWDPYPFILLNLTLSFQAAYAAPFVMMSQNRQSAKDRLTAENDYKTDVKGEQEICHIMEHLDHQDTLILQIVQRLEAQNDRINQQEQIILQLIQKIDTQQLFMKEQHQEMLRILNALPQEEAGQ